MCKVRCVCAREVITRSFKAGPGKQDARVGRVYLPLHRDQTEVDLTVIRCPAKFSEMFREISVLSVFSVVYSYVGVEESVFLFLFLFFFRLQCSSLQRAFKCVYYY